MARMKINFLKFIILTVHSYSRNLLLIKVVMKQNIYVNCLLLYIFKKKKKYTSIMLLILKFMGA